MGKFEQKPIEIVHDGEPIANSDEITLAILKAKMNLLADNFAQLEKCLFETRSYMSNLERNIKLSKEGDPNE